MTKPIVFNYQDYVALESQIADLREENDRLKEKVGNLEIRCRIAEEALTESQNNLLQFAMGKTWIPVEERLPDDFEHVLVTLGNGYDGVTYDWRSDGDWYDWGKSVIAWMPLPEPYKGGEDE